MLQIDNLSVTFSGQLNSVLNLDSLTLGRGQITVLLGPSGAGKSTLLRCLNGLVTPSEGSISVEGLGDLRVPANLERHRRSTGMVFQHHQLIGRLTALDNVLQGRLAAYSAFRSLLPLPRKEIRLGLECLDRVGLADKAFSRADQLSGGERQRVGVARALAQHPTLILADEPVASLDPESANEVMELFHRVCREDGLTAVLSLHQVEYARRFGDRIVGLSKGRMVFDGSPASLQPEHSSALYRREKIEALAR